MKTIAVLTDCSDQSAHAARFALHIARKLKSGVMLFDLSPVPSGKRTELQPAWGDDDCPENNEHAGGDLASFSRKLTDELQEKSLPGSYLPEITFGNENGEIADVMAAIVNNSDVTLIVTAPNGDDDMATFMLGEACRKIIDWATVPVLIVPGCADIRNFEKIAFATKLEEHDASYINRLVKFAEPFAPDVMIANLNDDNAGEADGKLKITNIYDQVDYGRIYYRNISCTHTKKDWDWLKANKRCDMLAMVQQPRETLKDFFNRGYTFQMMHLITIPMLIFPAVI